MFIDRAGIPFVLIALVLAVAAGWGGGRAWAVPFLVLAAFFVFFFRDPHRTTPTAPGLVVSPADGRVMIAGDPPGPGAPNGEWRQISIFLSPLDVHVNRTPVEGRVTHVEYHPGKFLPAYKVEAGQLNEWTEVWFERGGRPIVCRQIVGVLARRIVCRLEAGDVVSRGQRFGVMKFGSRIDLFVPPDARIRVKPGDRVVGGETVLATVS
ncbi:MAG: phosphatidylserine decarboxylase [Acidobacteria bacterium]|nr:phosphatidylserine decarboxylase [Acidobacteriota bacterium]